MNIIKQLIVRIEKYRKENKNPCKNYATEAACENAIAKMAQMVADHHGCLQPARYVVFYNEAWNRWNAAIDLNELIQRPEAHGGYIGLAASKGFHTY
jgi:hypothetical protein